MRLTRAAVLSVMSQPYIEMAELKGAKRRRIILLHALPNVLSTILNIVLLTLAYLVVGVVVVEAVFNYSGMGKLMVDAVCEAGRSPRAGLRADLRERVRDAERECRHPRHSRQPAAEATGPLKTLLVEADTGMRIGIAVLVIFAVAHHGGARAVPVRRDGGGRRRMGSAQCGPIGWGRTGSAGTC